MNGRLIIGVFALLAAVSMACGTPVPTSTSGPRVTHTPTTAHQTPTPTPTPVEQQPPVEICKEPTLEISVNGDALQFDKDRFQVAAATEVVLCFKNVSSINQHNWVLCKDGKKDLCAERGREFPDNGWVQPGDPDIIAHTKLLNPGESGAVRFTAPPAGTYQFVCTFPGHNFTMSGNFVVTP